MAARVDRVKGKGGFPEKTADPHQYLNWCEQCQMMVPLVPRSWADMETFKEHWAHTVRTSDRELSPIEPTSHLGLDVQGERPPADIVVLPGEKRGRE